VTLHDYIIDNRHTQKKRPEYNRLEEVLDMVDHSGDYLAVFARKESATDAQLSKLWRSHYRNIIG